MALEPRADGQWPEDPVTTERPPSMSRRERVYAALRGEPVDRVPVSFWGHDYAAENSAGSLAEATLRRASEFDWDYLKPQSRAQCFAEMWGLTYQPSGDRSTRYTITRYPLRGDASGLNTARGTPASGKINVSSSWPANASHTSMVHRAGAILAVTPGDSGPPRARLAAQQ